MQRRIVIAGGSGQVGTLLARRFQARGDSLVVLSRTPAARARCVCPWDGATLGPWQNELDGADVLINLTGRNVNCRYTSASRREILESRVQSTRILGQAVERCANPPRAWLNASTATIYRHSFDRTMDERTGEISLVQLNAPAPWNFSIEVATRWEQAFFECHSPSTRKIALRSAMVMSPDKGGIFDVLLRLARFGLGGAAGSGKQYVSWIHEADFLNAVDFLIDHEEFTGPVNLSSPNPTANREFMWAIRKAWGIPAGLSASTWMLEIGAVFLRTETELILKSRRVVPGKLLEAGFQFQFPRWKEAAEELVGQRRKGSLAS